ncbi:MAG: uracil-DNA glycosylase [Campylobacterota bacterium]|nr:uracil-DNA glycosylase [Campylobacterota bacterium]
MSKRIVCQKCKHYYVTWDSAKPHGCRAYGFKSKAVPSLVVKQSSNISCSFYEPKNNN